MTKELPNPLVAAASLKSLLREVIDEHLTSMYVCTRVWEAWNCGTMGESDFIHARETEFTDDLANTLESRLTELLAADKREAEVHTEAMRWREAIINELVIAHIYSKEHDDNPRKAIQDAISWNCAVALDPTVSSDAQALVEKGRAGMEKDAMRAEQALRKVLDVVRRFLPPDGPSIGDAMNEIIEIVDPWPLESKP